MEVSSVLKFNNERSVRVKVIFHIFKINIEKALVPCYNLSSKLLSNFNF